MRRYLSLGSRELGFSVIDVTHTQAIWYRFLAFNRLRGNAVVSAGFLLGFMRKWRTPFEAYVPTRVEAANPTILGPHEGKVRRLVASVQTKNRQFNERDGNPPRI